MFGPAVNLGLLKKRQVYLRGRLSVERVSKIKKIINGLGKSSAEPIYLHLNSRGGNHTASIELAKSIADCPAPVIGLVSKRADSGAVFILQACDRRIGVRGSKYRIHYNYIRLPLTISPFMDTDGLKQWLDTQIVPNLEHEWLEGEAFLLPRIKATGKSRKDLHDALRANKEFSAEEALEWGLLDEVV